MERKLLSPEPPGFGGCGESSLRATLCLAQRISAWPPERTSEDKLHQVINMQHNDVPIAPKPTS